MMILWTFTRLHKRWSFGAWGRRLAVPGSRREAFHGWFWRVPNGPVRGVLWLPEKFGDFQMRGRRRELNLPLDLLRGAEAGRGGILLVEGEPGIGKSRILRELSDAAARHRFSLVCNAADKPLDQLPDDLSRAHAASGPAQPLLALSAGAGPGAGGRDGWDAAVSPGPAAAPGTPGRLLIVVDDVHCADPETLRRLDGLLRRAQPSAPLWILARSTVAPSRDAEQLFDRLERAGAVRMRLAPLDDQAVAAVAADLLGASPGKSLLALAAGAEGNALLLVELLAGLQEEGRVQIDQSSAELVPGELPRRLRGVVHRWVAGLSPGARELLEVGAVLGQSFQVDHVAALLGKTPAGLLSGIESALAARILVAVPDALVFRWALVWRAILDGVPAPVRYALHRQAGEFLLQVGSSATHAAAHMIRGSRPWRPLLAAPAADRPGGRATDRPGGNGCGRIDCRDAAQRRGDAGSVGPGRAAAGRREDQAARPAGGRPAAQRPSRGRGLRGGPGAERARAHRSLA